MNRDPFDSAGDSPGKPTIRIAPGNLPALATEGEKAVQGAGFQIYQRGESLVRPVVDTVEAARGRKTKVARLRAVDATYLRDVLCRAADWQRFDARTKKWRPADAPGSVAATVLARDGEWTFPVTVGVISTPTMRPDGSVLSVPGYDPATRLVLIDPPMLPALPEQPSRDDALTALALLDGLFAEFPFVDAASRSVVLSALLTAVCRGAFPLAPLHAATAPSAGTGKSYLFDVVAAVATGQLCPVISAGESGAELDKRLASSLIAGQSIINLDNVSGELGGDFLCQAIERPLLDIRILGLSKHVRIENKSTLLFTSGNNLVLRGDLTRRTLRCQLDAEMERPEDRAFAGDPVATVLADRGRYIGAALTVVRAYIVAGRPDPLRPLGSFEGWSNAIRSALIWLGRADPAATMAAIYADDPERATLIAVLSAWADAFGTGPQTRQKAADLIRAAEERDTVLAGEGEAHEGYERPYRYPALRDAVAATAPRGRLDARGFGNWLRASKGRVVGRLRLACKTGGGHHGADWWVDDV